MRGSTPNAHRGNCAHTILVDIFELIQHIFSFLLFGQELTNGFENGDFCITGTGQGSCFSQKDSKDLWVTSDFGETWVSHLSCSQKWWFLPRSPHLAQESARKRVDNDIYTPSRLLLQAAHDENANVPQTTHLAAEKITTLIHKSP